MPATSGRNGSLIRKNTMLWSQRGPSILGRNAPAMENTAIDTSATMTMNVVPQRG